jgi:hypothetical protein
MPCALFCLDATGSKRTIAHKEENGLEFFGREWAVQYHACGFDSSHEGTGFLHYRNCFIDGHKLLLAHEPWEGTHENPPSFA